MLINQFQLQISSLTLDLLQFMINVHLNLDQFCHYVMHSYSWEVSFDQKQICQNAIYFKKDKYLNIFDHLIVINLFFCMKIIAKFFGKIKHSKVNMKSIPVQTKNIRLVK